MTTLREAAQQALEYMKSVGKMDMYPEDWAIVERLEAALAESNPKPLAEWQINDLMVDIDPEDVYWWSFRQGVYAAEKHHGVRP